MMTNEQQKVLRKYRKAILKAIPIGQLKGTRGFVLHWRNKPANTERTRELILEDWDRFEPEIRKWLEYVLKGLP